MSNLEELIRVIVRDELRRHLTGVMYEFEYSYEFEEKVRQLEASVAKEIESNGSI